MEATAAAAAAGVDLCSQPNRLALCLGAEKLTALTCKQTSQHLSLLSHVSIKGNAYSSCLPVRTHQWAAAAAFIHSFIRFQRSLGPTMTIGPLD